MKAEPAQQKKGDWPVGISGLITADGSTFLSCRHADWEGFGTPMRAMYLSYFQKKKCDTPKNQAQSHSQGDIHGASLPATVEFKASFFFTDS